jgi:hypothetical protein
VFDIRGHVQAVEVVFDDVLSRSRVPA